MSYRAKIPMILVVLLAKATVGYADLTREPAAIRTCDRVFESIGPTVKMLLPGALGAQKDQTMKSLRVAHWNVEDFKLFERAPLKPRADGRILRERPLKPTWAVESIVQSIERERPDVLFLSEIVCKDSLDALAEKLAGVYEPILIEGNDMGEIDVGILVRRSMPFEIEVQSHRAVTHNYRDVVVPLYNRDLLLLTLRRPGDPRALLSMVGSHLKAIMLSRSNVDRALSKRLEQLRFGVDVLEQEKKAKRPRGTVFLGDFNADVTDRSQFRALHESGYREVLDVMKMPRDRRATYTGFLPGVGLYQSGTDTQLDGIFISSELSNREAILSAYVVQDRQMGKILPSAASKVELMDRPSNHRMEIMEIDLQKLR